MPEMRAYAWRSGKIEFGELVPDGALLIAVGPEEELRAEVKVLARSAYDNKTLLVPGVPEAETDSEAMDALFEFKDRVEAGLRMTSNGA